MTGAEICGMHAQDGGASLESPAARKLPQPSWARSPASPSAAVLEQRAKAWHQAHHARIAVAEPELEEQSAGPLLKRQRC